MIPTYCKQYVEILEFTHFVSFFSFDKIGENHKEKVLVNKVTVVVALDLDTRNTKNSFLLIGQSVGMEMYTMRHWCIAWGLMRTQEEILKQSMILRQGVSKRNACIMAGLQAEVQR